MAIHGMLNIWINLYKENMAIKEFMIQLDKQLKKKAL